MHATITITDADRLVDYVLEVLYDFAAGSRPRLGYLDGGDPGEGPRVAVFAVLCREVVTWCGKHALAAEPETSIKEKQLGAWCLEKYREEIKAAVLKTQGAEVS